jgi:hypothetical protein
MTDEFSLPRFSKGKRPAFFEEDGVDHLLAMGLELATELTVVYARVDRLEHYLASTGQLDRAALEAFEPGAEATDVQDKRRDLFLERLFSSVRQQAVPHESEPN